MFGMSDASEFAILMVLLPLVPAMLIFLVFPKTEMTASGPLQGLSIRAGGAFGAYLVVLLVLLGWLSWSDLQKTTRTWTVLADVLIKDEKGRVINPRLLDANGLGISFEPTYLQKGIRGNRFRVKVTATELNHRIPSMTITYAGIGSAFVDLSDVDPELQAERNDIRNEYRIKTPLVIEQLNLPGLEAEPAPARPAT